MNNNWSIFYDTEFKIIKNWLDFTVCSQKKHPLLSIWYETLKCGLSTIAHVNENF